LAFFDGRRVGRRILLDILVLRPDPPSDLTSLSVRALLDTGATASAVGRATAEAMSLPSIGKRPIVTAGGTVMAEHYLFRAGFAQPGGYPFVFDDLTGFELFNADRFDAVLGMDVLSRCDVLLYRDGRCHLDFG
jgi:gag-polyprotein putative aspartyl protease